MTTAIQVRDRLVDGDTGEIISEPGVDLVETLDTYYRAHGEATLARLDYEKRRAEILTALEDPELEVAQQRMQTAQATLGAIEESLAELRPTEDPLRSISLDTGRVRVTWGKARTTWRYGIKARDLASRDPELADRLGVRKIVGQPPAPRITVRVTE